MTVGDPLVAIHWQQPISNKTKAKVHLLFSIPIALLDHIFYCPNKKEQLTAAGYVDKQNCVYMCVCARMHMCVCMYTWVCVHVNVCVCSVSQLHHVKITESVC